MTCYLRPGILIGKLTRCSALLACLMGAPALAQDDGPNPIDTIIGKVGKFREDFRKIREGGGEDWHFSAYVDGGYLRNIDHPDADRWRSKSTSFKLDGIELNMAELSVRKDVNPTASRWGAEFGIQTGVDTEGLVPNAQGHPMGSADTLRHISRANIAYLAPIGNGLKITAGLMNSYIGYSSFHAIDNVNYTRGYLLDNVPYFLFGTEVVYPATDTLTLAFYVVNGYNYLAKPNSLPSYGLHTLWQATSHLTLVQNFYYGPDQENTNRQFWRFFSDSILEWKEDRWSLAASYDFGTEKQAGAPGQPRQAWMSGAVWWHWDIVKPWRVGVRPEFYWDPSGVITGAEQLIWAITSTLECRIAVIMKQHITAKLEYRFDRSTGSGGGFFTGPSTAPGTVALTPNQQLVILGLMWAFKS